MFETKEEMIERAKGDLEIQEIIQMGVSVWDAIRVASCVGEALCEIGRSDETFRFKEIEEVPDGLGVTVEFDKWVGDPVELDSLFIVVKSEYDCIQTVIQ